MDVDVAVMPEDRKGYFITTVPFDTLAIKTLYELGIGVEISIYNDANDWPDEQDGEKQKGG